MGVDTVGLDALRTLAGGMVMSTEADRPTEPETASLLPTEEAVEEGEEVGERVRQSDGTFTSSGAAEAARARWAKERERDTEAAQAAPDRIVWVRTPVNLGKAVAALARAAEKGDVRAMAELRAVMREHPVEDHTDISALDARTQQQVLSRLLAEIEADEGELPLQPLEGGGSEG